MAPRTRLPYARPSDELPAPLPSLEQVKTEHIHVLKDTYGHRVVQMNDHYVARYGTTVSQAQGEALLFLERNASISAPRLHAMYADELDGGVCLIMDLVPGENLALLWPTLTMTDKDTICTALRSYFEELRSLLQTEQSFIGGVDRGQVQHHLFYDPHGSPAMMGPFVSERAFNDASAMRLKSIGEDNNASQYINKSAWYERNMSKHLRDHPITFTHGDLQRKNVLVQREVGNDHRSRFKVTMIDWEAAGWFPSYWEYFVAFVALEWDDDWCEKLEKIVEPRPAETALMHMIYKELSD